MEKIHRQRFSVPATRPHSIEVLGTTIAQKKRHWWAFENSRPRCHAFFTLKSMMGKIYKCQTLQHGKMERQTILPAGASFPSHSYPRISITWSPTQSLGVF